LAVARAKQRYGFARHYTDWEELVADPEVEVLDNIGPTYLHSAPCIAAARAGKHVLCEKPLARNAQEAKEMLDAVAGAGVLHMVAHNYRFVPALILAREIVKSGRLGEVRHFRGRYLQEGGVDPYRPMTWRLRSETAGTGALGDLGSHTIDLARWLIGEIGAVTGLTRTFVAERPSVQGDRQREQVTVDDAAIFLLEFENGAIGTLEATRLAPGCKNSHVVEINGSAGSISFNLERLNELQVYSTEDPPDVRGFRDVLVTEANHPYYAFWWPRGHVLGWEHTFVHEVYHFLRAVARGEPIAPQGATFDDGYRTALVVDAVVESARSRRQVPLRYEG
jgi:predicted dehydrogenase